MQSIHQQATDVHDKVQSGLKNMGDWEWLYHIFLLMFVAVFFVYFF